MIKATILNFLQYHHLSSCKAPCDDCPERDNRIYENGFYIRLPAHPNCDCIYTEVKTLAVGTISKRGLESPDVYLKLYGHLPDYYITKEEAKKIMGGTLEEPWQEKLQVK